MSSKTHPPATRQVDPGLDAERVPGHQLEWVSRDDVGILVLLEPDAVAGAVDEELAVTSVGDDLPGRVVDVLARGPHGRRGDSGSLSRPEDRVRFGDLGARLAGEHATGDVAAVAVHRAAEVAEHDLSLLDGPVGSVVVRARRVLAGGDDREVHPLVALGDESGSDVLRDLRLGAPHE